MSRAILIGMCNPQGGEALWPDPPGCAGWRLWQMLNEVCGASQQDYLRMFTRMNVLPVREWDLQEARRVGPRLWGGISGRRVIVCGREAAGALGLPDVEWLTPQTTEKGGEWRLIPHPSGRTRWYNERAHRRMVGMLLEEMANVGVG